MQSGKALLGIFSYADDVCHAIHDLYKAGFNELMTYTPIPVHEIEHALEEGRPKFQWNLAFIWDQIKKRDFHLHRITITGSFTGISAAITLYAVSHLLWPLRQGGFPLFAGPPLGLVSYEMMTLFSGIFTIVGFMYLSRLPFLGKDVYDVRLGEDKFGIALRVKDSKLALKATEIMKKHGADEVTEREGALRV